MSPLVRINISGDNVRSIEAIYLKKYLERTRSVEAYYVSKKSKETDERYIDIFSIDSLNNFDMVIIHNFNTNLFGGVAPAMAIKYCELLSTFNGRVFYYITDPKLKYSNIAAEFLKRKSIKFEKGSNEENIEILRDCAESFKFLELRIGAIYTGYNYSPIYGLEFSPVKKVNIFEYAATDIIQKYEIKDSETKEWDCCYYGDNRGTYRNNRLKNYLDNDAIKSMTIGLDTNLQNNTHFDKVKHSKLGEMVNRSLSSLVIGDEEHENQLTTFRFYENIIFNTVSFIDIRYDKEKNLFKSQELKDFNYITSYMELADKIQQLKTDNNFRKHILELQKKDIFNN